MFDQIANQESLEATIQALKTNGIGAEIVETGEEAKIKVLALFAKNSEVMTMTSVTLDSIGLTQAINETGEYRAVKPALAAMDESQADEKRKLGAGPKYTVGSVHAVTENGEVIIASNTGSQLPAYAYGAEKVIWVVGTQKIVKNLDEGMKRIYDYVLPKEADRARKAYGSAGSNVSKLLIVNKEVNADRIRIIFVKENLGF